MPETMSAAVYHGAGDIRIERVPVPAPADDEVLVKVLRSGVCGTDAGEWTRGPRVFPVAHRHPNSGHLGPLIPGHEFVGEVVESASSDFPVGTLVASGAGIWCGDCARCREGRTNLCATYQTLGLNRHGALAEYVAVAKKTLHVVPDGVSVDIAAIAQPLAVGIHAARRSGARAGERIVIIGAGAIGSFILAGLNHLGDHDITVVDFPGRRLDRALTLGAARTRTPSSSPAAAICDALDGHAPSVVIEASGAPGQLAAALQTVDDGGRVLAVGIPKTDVTIDLHSAVFREITIETTLAHICDVDIPAALEIIEASPSVWAEFVEPPVALRELGSALDRLASGGVDGKILIDPQRE
ncbi:zinc-dependent alcohol dehydrogenase [Gordonia asplenii]|nr:alcohol dehydrogenase catalytic domain-containing protein [Gordonia asplenii]